MFPAFDEDRFYAERDSRIVAAGPMRSAVATVAVVLPPAVGTGLDALTLLGWTSSLLRRLGRAFSRSIIISALTESARAPIEQELVGADPFGPIEWRPFASESFADIDVALWLGAFEALAPAAVRSVAVAAHGWTCRVMTAPAAEEPPAVDAASPTLAAAASQAVAEVYKQFTGPERSPAITSLWTAMDTGLTTSDEGAGSGWFTRGGANDVPLPWSGADSAPTLVVDRLLFVGAGALGWNAARILVEAPVATSECVIVDHDRLDISNLNRLVGSRFADAGQFKSELVAGTLSQRGKAARAVTEKFETWVKRGEHLPFLAQGSAVMVGVDSALTRLHVAAEWPHLLVNGATSGLRWSTSLHRPGKGACLGCYYGSGRQPFDELRRGVPCGAAAVGIVPAAPVVVTPSFPFVSFAAAAHMVAILVHELTSVTHGLAGAGALSGVFREQNALAGDAARVMRRDRDPGCRLLCGKDTVRSVLESR